MSIRVVRYLFQAFFLVSITYLAFGLGATGFEAFCPFGGVESFYALFTEGNFTCALAPLNLSMFIGILLLTILIKRSFCGWVCPIGTIAEWIGKIGDKIWKGRPRIPHAFDKYLRHLRYFALAAILYYTYTMGDLMFRGYDPFYLMFSGMGHGSLGWISISVIVVFVIGSFFQPMFFCRYFCPLAATLDPFSKIGLVKITRNTETCTDCTLCNKRCHFGVDVMRLQKVTHRDCVNCLECVEVCPIENCLEVKAL